MIDSQEVLYSAGSNDECMTLDYAVEPIIKYIPKDWVIWCPFDTEDSEFVKQIRANGNKVIYSHISEGKDFYTYEPDEHWDCIISNPPYSLAKEFVEKSMPLLNDGYDEDGYPNGQLIMFLKIQFLEGAKRKELFEKYPPKYIYVFRNRMATWNNGEPLDPNGKRWATTMCHAWFVWEKGSTTEPIVRWLD